MLLHPAFGDHQVANVTAEVEARTIGARAHRPAPSPAARPTSSRCSASRRSRAYPFDGSGIVYWDTGPLRDGGDEGHARAAHRNVPPREGNDPAQRPRATIPVARAAEVRLPPGSAAR